jgi:hypothetical protein
MKTPFIVVWMIQTRDGLLILIWTPRVDPSSFELRTGKRAATYPEIVPPPLHSDLPADKNRHNNFQISILLRYRSAKQKRGGFVRAGKNVDCADFHHGNGARGECGWPGCIRCRHGNGKSGNSSYTESAGRCP